MLDAFFVECATREIPVLAHAARSNGRDTVHDEFSGPEGWRRVLQRSSASNLRVSLGHFGGGSGPDWTRAFGTVMQTVKSPTVFADLGYWEELMCTPSTGPCEAPRQRLAAAMRLPLEGSETAVDRVMFATDWLMLSQVRRWADYPTRLQASLHTFLSDGDAAKVTAGNARRFFRLNATS